MDLHFGTFLNPWIRHCFGFKPVMWHPVISERSEKTFTTSISPSVFLVGTGWASSLVPELPTLLFVSPLLVTVCTETETKTSHDWVAECEEPVRSRLTWQTGVCVCWCQPNLHHRTCSWGAPEHAQFAQMAIRTWLPNERVGGGGSVRQQSISITAARHQRGCMTASVRVST